MLYTNFTLNLNCSLYDISCLKGKSVQEIINSQVIASTVFSKSLTNFESWIPWIDGQIIKAQLLDINAWMQSGSFPLKPLIIGYTTGEGISFVYEAWSTPMSIEEYSYISMLYFGAKATQVLTKFPPNILSSDQRIVVSKIIGDLFFSCSSQNFAKSYSKLNNNLYMYVFDFIMDFSGWEWENKPFCNGYACHGGDLSYIFGILNAYFSKNGRLLSLQMIKYWTDFAKKSTPNSNESFAFEGKDLNNLYWPKYELTSQFKLRFKNGSNDIDSHFLNSSCSFIDLLGFDLPFSN